MRAVFGLRTIVLRHDRRKHFRLLAAQTPLGAPLYMHYGLDPKHYETNVLMENGHIWLKSEGSIRMFEGLGFPWSMAALGRLLPRSLRDWMYDIVARNRLKWFGTREVCFLSSPGFDDRFLS